MPAGESLSSQPELRTIHLGYVETPHDSLLMFNRAPYRLASTVMIKHLKKKKDGLSTALVTQTNAVLYLLYLSRLFRGEICWTLSSVTPFWLETFTSETCPVQPVASGVSWRLSCVSLASTGQTFSAGNQIYIFAHRHVWWGDYLKQPCCASGASSKPMSCKQQEEQTYSSSNEVILELLPTVTWFGWAGSLLFIFGVICHFISTR